MLVSRSTVLAAHPKFAHFVSQLVQLALQFDKLLIEHGLLPCLRPELVQNTPVGVTSAVGAARCGNVWRGLRAQRSVWHTRPDQQRQGRGRAGQTQVIRSRQAS
jgi:hypothetical protein